jgi:hypothetical protein
MGVRWDMDECEGERELGRGMEEGIESSGRSKIKKYLHVVLRGVYSIRILRRHQPLLLHPDQKSRQQGHHGQSQDQKEHMHHMHHISGWNPQDLAVNTRHSAVNPLLVIGRRSQLVRSHEYSENKVGNRLTGN